MQWDLLALSAGIVFPPVIALVIIFQLPTKERHPMFREHYDYQEHSGSIPVTTWRVAGSGHIVAAGITPDGFYLERAYYGHTRREAVVKLRAALRSASRD